MRGFGDSQFVPSEGNSPFGVSSVGDCGRFKGTAERFASDEKDACGLVRRLVGSGSRK